MHSRTLGPVWRQLSVSGGRFGLRVGTVDCTASNGACGLLIVFTIHLSPTHSYVCVCAHLSRPVPQVQGRAHTYCDTVRCSRSVLRVLGWSRWGARRTRFKNGSERKRFNKSREFNTFLDEWSVENLLTFATGLSPHEQLLARSKSRLRTDVARKLQELQEDQLW